VDNYVSNVYKGHVEKLSFMAIFDLNTLINKGILIKDMKIILNVSRETYNHEVPHETGKMSIKYRDYA